MHEEIFKGLPENFPTSVWDPEKPGLQVVWDSTSTKTGMECWQRYKLHCVDGWSTTLSKTDAEYGHAYGAGLEVFYKRVIEHGDTHDDALRHAILAALSDTWREDAPTLGAYIDVWRCLGTTKYRNRAGRAAKCPWSHKGKLFPAPGPHTCNCGSLTESLNAWFPDVAGKDRAALIRAIVWYTDDQKGAGLATVSLPQADGTQRAMVEVPWAMPLAGGFWLMGWWDKVAALGDEVFITDHKSTKKTLNDDYFAQYNPNVQVSFYDPSGDLLRAAGIQYKGVMIEAAQMMVGGVRFASRVYTISAARRAEFGHDLGRFFAEAVRNHATGHYPRNRAACFLCEFKRVCGAEPHERPHILAEHYERSRWNPIKRTREVLTEETADGT